MRMRMTMKMMIMIMMMMMMMMLHGTEAKMDIITSKQDVQVGEDILLLCKAGGEGDILWLKDGEDIADEEQVSKMDESTSKLLVRGAAARDAGRYTCHCEFDNGHRDEVTTQLYVYEGPSFGNTSTYHEFLEGTDGVLPCHVTGQPAVDVHWLRHREPLSSDGGRRVRQLPDGAARIDAVRREDAGTYVCQAQIRGRPIAQELPVSVVVNAPASARLRAAERRVLAAPDTNVSLRCLVDGLPKPNVSWTTPVLSDPTRRQFNSDRSQMTISSVGRADGGEYVCTARNKISESSATFRLHVDEAPEVFVSAEQQRASLGDRVSVSCNVSGHPQPELHWLNKHNGHTLDSSSAPVRAVGGALVIDAVAPSDGGTYSCMAVSSSGNASRDVAIHTQPGAPPHLSVSPGPTSVLFSLTSLPVSGGTPISSFVLQWRRRAAAPWEEATVPASGPLSVSSLQPYTLYTVRLAAQNAVGVGQFSDAHAARTLGVRGEPDRPVLLTNEMTVEGNSFSVPLQQADDGGAALLHFDLRYKQDEEGTEWTEMELPPNADSVSLKDLSFGSDYRLEVVSINPNGSSIPAVFNFTIADQPVRPSRLSSGSVVGIVMVVFLVVFLAVDAACCYRNRCGLLMSIAVKVFGHKVPGLRRLEQGEGTNGEVKLKSISTPRGSVQLSEAGEQKLSKDGGPVPEVTCDKAPLTQHQKNQAGRELRAGNA